MKKEPTSSKPLNAEHKVTSDHVTPESQAARLNGRAGTPIETYKGDPDATRTSEEGDLEEETLDRNAPYNKTYGIRDESDD